MAIPSFNKFLSQYFQIEEQSLSFPVSSICSNSKLVIPNSLFVALKGQTEDGHHHLPEVIKNGAKILLLEDSSQVPKDFSGLVLKTKNSYQDLSLLLNEFYDFPSEKLFTIGVTGTNGKTSISYMVEHILKFSGWPTGVIGTINCRVQNQKWESNLTTPASAELFQRLQNFIDQGAKSCVMEASSIGLDQNRLQGITFRAAIFTNLTQDHLDYHSSFEDYFQAKKKLFLNPKDKNFFSIINKDDEYGNKLLKTLKTKTYSYGQQDSDFQFKIKNQTLNQTEFELQSSFGLFHVCLPLTGIYNIYNAVASLACAATIGFSLKEAIKSLASFSGVPGRLEKVTNSQHPFQVFVDYAHTPLALSSVLECLNSFKTRQLIVVFGCGGNRDQSKRPLMMKEALKFADHIILSSDNPRFEDPQKIIQDCLQGLDQKSLNKISIEVDREKAIEQALDKAQKEDIVLVAGKGHEDYQVIGKKKITFSDKKVIQSLL